MSNRELPVAPRPGDHIRHSGKYYEVVQVYWGRLGNTVAAYHLHTDGLPIGHIVHLNQDSVRVISA